MNYRTGKPTGRECVAVFAVMLLLFGAASRAQNVAPELPAITEPGNDASDFRTETIPVAGGAELITIFAKQSNFSDGEGSTTSEMPLVSVVRDTLGDSRPENDKLRYVWMLTYTRPAFWQKAAAFVPFLYSRTGNKSKVGTAPPPAIADMQASNKALWNSILWLAFRKVVLSGYGFGPRASAGQYRQNVGDYRRSAIAGALSVLAAYQKSAGETVLSDQELRDIQARLWLTDKPLGEMIQDENLDRMFEKSKASIEDNRGHNWELLRQYTEAQGLYFEPIEMPDGSATHAIVWTTDADVAANAGRKFDGRFLNIKNPWTDANLRQWKGYTQIKWFGPDGRPADAGTPNAVERKMIPLAVYGLDTRKIPGILIDFRNDGNAKRREMSRRVLNDVAGNVLSISKLDLPYMLGRSILDFVTGRRGTDINQAERIRSYSQLKMLLALDQSLAPELRSELATRVEDVSLNPLQNDLEAEARIARTQYRNLVDYARRPDGLAAKLERSRREEMVKYAHSGRERTFLNLAHVLTLGAYTHREKPTPENLAAMDTGRQLQFHERVINETAQRSVRPEVDTDVARLRRSLLFLSENGVEARAKTAKGLAQIFAMTADDDMRKLCITALYKIDNSTAKAELLAIYSDPRVGNELRDISAQFLKQAIAEGKRVSPRTAAGIAALAVN